MKTKFSWLLLLLFSLTACVKKESNLIGNSGFEQPLLTGLDSLWRNVVHAGEEAYKFSIDTEKGYQSSNSYKIHQFKPQTFGLVNQTIDIKSDTHKAFEFSAMLHTQGVKADGGLVLVINVLAADGYIIKQYKSEALIGDTEWVKVTIKDDIHKAANRLSAGAMLLSEGTAWIDDVTLTVQ